MPILNHLNQIRNDFPGEKRQRSAYRCRAAGAVMKFQFNDGGRAAAGYQGEAGDCVTRAIAIATGKPYQEVYDAMWSGIRDHGAKHRNKASRRLNRRHSPRNGVSRKVYEQYLESLGWKWFPTMAIGQGCKVHLKDGELPNGRLIVRVSKHVVAVIDGVINDTFDEQRDGTRCVYGYYYSQQDPSKTEFEKNNENPGSEGNSMSESPERYESKAVYVEKLATFIFREGRWDVCLYNESFNDGQKYFLVRIPIPPELITGTIDAEVTSVKLPY